MAVNLGNAGQKARHQPEEIGFGHTAVIQEAKKLVIIKDSRRPGQPRRPAAEQGEDDPLGHLGEGMVRSQGQGGAPTFAGQAHRRDAILQSQVQHQGEYFGVQVQVDVAVELPGSQPGRQHGFDLSARSSRSISGSNLGSQK